MAKSFGEIMAAGEMARRAAQIQNAGACPLCGAPLSKLDSQHAFCYGESERDKCPSLSELEAAFDAHASEADRKRGHPLYPFQAQIVGYALTPDDTIIAILYTTRGGGGRTNLRLDMTEGELTLDDYSTKQAAGQITWTWADWYKKDTA